MSQLSINRLTLQDYYRTSRLRWHALTRTKMNGDGESKRKSASAHDPSLLCVFALHCCAQAMVDLPPVKTDAPGTLGVRYTVPRGIRLEFEPYDVRLLCIGLRNVKRWTISPSFS